MAVMSECQSIQSSFESLVNGEWMKMAKWDNADKAADKIFRALFYEFVLHAVSRKLQFSVV